jgi:hypothetical protein
VSDDVNSHEIILSTARDAMAVLPSPPFINAPTYPPLREQGIIHKESNRVEAEITKTINCYHADTKFKRLSEETSG